MFLKGLVYLSFGQLVFILCGFTLNFGLARYFGPELFGTYSIVISILVWVKFFTISGIPVGLQKFIPGNLDKVYNIKKSTIKIQIIYSSIVFLSLYVGSTYIAKIFNQPSLAVYLKIVSFDIIFYSMFRYFVGFQNGLQRFNYQSTIVIFYSICKLIATFLLVFLGFSLKGALVGNIIGSFIACLIGFKFAKIKKTNSIFNIRRIIYFAIPNVFYSVLFNLFYIDLIRKMTINYVLFFINKNYILRQYFRQRHPMEHIIH